MNRTSLFGFYTVGLPRRGRRVNEMSEVRREVGGWPERELSCLGRGFITRSSGTRFCLVSPAPCLHVHSIEYLWMIIIHSNKHEEGIREERDCSGQPISQRPASWCWDLVQGPAGKLVPWYATARQVYIKELDGKQLAYHERSACRSPWQATASRCGINGLGLGLAWPVLPCPALPLLSVCTAFGSFGCC